MYGPGLRFLTMSICSNPWANGRRTKTIYVHVRILVGEKKEIQVAFAVCAGREKNSPKIKKTDLAISTEKCHKIEKETQKIKKKNNQKSKKIPNNQKNAYKNAQKKASKTCNIFFVAIAVGEKSMSVPQFWVGDGRTKMYVQWAVRGGRKHIVENLRSGP